MRQHLLWDASTPPKSTSRSQRYAKVQRLRQNLYVEFRPDCTSSSVKSSCIFSFFSKGALIIALNFRHISASVIKSQCRLYGPIHTSRVFRKKDYYACVVCYNKCYQQNDCPGPDDCIPAFILSHSFYFSAPLDQYY
ncbi:hypothetical protein INR49_030287 [Caranx melampygus]|nr:hypothetical protein INR49_030287 [Caranx melampygus]